MDTSTGRIEQALEVFLRVCLLNASLLAVTASAIASDGDWETLQEQARRHYDEGNGQLATKTAQRAATLAEELYGADHDSVATALNLLGWIQVQQGNALAAEAALHRAFRIRSNAVDVIQEDLQQVVDNLGRLYSALLRDRGHNVLLDDESEIGRAAATWVLSLESELSDLQRAVLTGNRADVLVHLTDRSTTSLHDLGLLIHTAVLMGHMDVALLLLQRGVAPTTENLLGQTVLHAAASRGMTPLVSQILDRHEIDIDYPDSKGQTPLYLAARNGHVDVVERLLARKADPSIRATLSETALHGAASGKVPPLHLTATVAHLYPESILGQRLSAFGFKRFPSPRKQESIIELLIEHGADISATDEHGWTGLHLAAKWGLTAVAETLLNKGANIDVRDELGFSPLHTAAESGHVDMMRVLHARGASLDVRETFVGDTPLISAAKFGHPEAVRYLLELGADASVRNKRSLDALMAAVESGHDKTVVVLLESGMDPNTTGEWGEPLLHLTVQGAKVENLMQKPEFDVSPPPGMYTSRLPGTAARVRMVRQLILHGAKVDALDSFGMSALHRAAAAGQHEIAEELLRQGAAHARRAPLGATALHLAANANHYRVVRILLEHGAGADLLDAEAQTALFIAYVTSAKESVDALEKYTTLPAFEKHLFTSFYEARAGSLAAATRACDAAGKSITSRPDDDHRHSRVLLCQAQIAFESANTEKAEALLLANAARGSALAQVALGQLYQSGATGIAADHERAFHWYRQAAAQGHHAGLNGLGWMYQHGLGVAADLPRSAELYRKSAEAGNPTGSNNLGYAYANGYGVEQNYEKAALWYRNAAVAGELNAMINLGLMYLYGHGVERDAIMAYALHSLAYKGGAHNAMAAMQSMRGRFDDRDLYEAQMREARWIAQYGRPGSNPFGSFR